MPSKTVMNSGDDFCTRLYATVRRSLSSWHSVFAEDTNCIGSAPGCTRFIERDLNAFNTSIDLKVGTPQIHVNVHLVFRQPKTKCKPFQCQISQWSLPAAI